MKKVIIKDMKNLIKNSVKSEMNPMKKIFFQIHRYCMIFFIATFVIGMNEACALGALNGFYGPMVSYANVPDILKMREQIYGQCSTNNTLSEIAGISTLESLAESLNDSVVCAPALKQRVEELSNLERSLEFEESSALISSALISDDQCSAESETPIEVRRHNLRRDAQLSFLNYCSCIEGSTLGNLINNLSESQSQRSNEELINDMAGLIMGGGIGNEADAAAAMVEFVNRNLLNPVFSEQIFDYTLEQWAQKVGREVESKIAGSGAANQGQEHTRNMKKACLKKLTSRMDEIHTSNSQFEFFSRGQGGPSVACVNQANLNGYEKFKEHKTYKDLLNATSSGNEEECLIPDAELKPLLYGLEYACLLPSVISNSEGPTEHYPNYDLTEVLKIYKIDHIFSILDRTLNDVQSNDLIPQAAKGDTQMLVSKIVCDSLGKAILDEAQARANRGSCGLSGAISSGASLGLEPDALDRVLSNIGNEGLGQSNLANNPTRVWKEIGENIVEGAKDIISESAKTTVSTLPSLNEGGPTPSEQSALTPKSNSSPSEGSQVPADSNSGSSDSLSDNSSSGSSPSSEGSIGDKVSDFFSDFLPSSGSDSNKGSRSPASADSRPSVRTTRESRRDNSSSNENTPNRETPRENETQSSPVTTSRPVVSESNQRVLTSNQTTTFLDSVREADTPEIAENLINSFASTYNGYEGLPNALGLARKLLGDKISARSEREEESSSDSSPSTSPVARSSESRDSTSTRTSTSAPAPAQVVESTAPVADSAPRALPGPGTIVTAEPFGPPPPPTASRPQARYTVQTDESSNGGQKVLRFDSVPEVIRLNVEPGQNVIAANGSVNYQALLPILQARVTSDFASGQIDIGQPFEIEGKTFVLTEEGVCELNSQTRECVVVLDVVLDEEARLVARSEQGSAIGAEERAPASVEVSTDVETDPESLDSYKQFLLDGGSQVEDDTL